MLLVVLALVLFVLMKPTSGLMGSYLPSLPGWFFVFMFISHVDALRREEDEDEEKDEEA